MRREPSRAAGTATGSRAGPSQPFLQPLIFLALLAIFFLPDQSETHPFWFITRMLHLLNSWVVKQALVVVVVVLILLIALNLSSGSVCLINQRYKLSVTFSREGNRVPEEWGGESQDHETCMWCSWSESKAVLGVFVPSHWRLSAETHTPKWTTATRAQPRLLCLRILEFSLGNECQLFVMGR